MTTLTLGKMRGLQQLANEQGIFTITALDHRGSLESTLRQTFGGDTLEWATVVQEKERLLRVLGPLSSAILLDPLYGAGPMIARGALPGRTGLLVALEETGYDKSSEGRLTRLQPGWSVAAIKRLGAAAVKLLLYYHPESPSAAQQEALVQAVAADCRQHDLALLVEPVCYPLQPGQKKSDPAFARQKPDIVIETARRLAPLGLDVLKAEFPTDPDYEQDQGRMADYCRQLTEVAGIPWVLLSAGVDFATFQRQVEIACEAGASGFLAGRAIWQEGMRLAEAKARDRFFETIAASRLAILVDIANYRATPWTERIGPEQRPQLEAGWHATYAAG
jgi:tagatose 1,6-diphosphate aldolase